jgi:hypothetical protein
MMRGDYFLVMNDPLAGREADYHDWYNNIHVPDLLRLPGVSAAQRFRAVPGLEAGAPLAGHLALYEFSDTSRALANLASRRGTHLLRPTDATDRSRQAGHIMTVRHAGGTAGTARASRGALILLLTDSAEAAQTAFGLGKGAAEAALLERSPVQQMPDPHPAFAVLLAFASGRAARKTWTAIAPLAGAGSAAAWEPVRERLVAS